VVSRPSGLVSPPGGHEVVPEASWVDPELLAKSVRDGDPWDLEDAGQKRQEFAWFEEKVNSALPDGGNESHESD
jgi:hypothetical protein